MHASTHLLTHQHFLMIQTTITTATAMSTMPINDPSTPPAIAPARLKQSASFKESSAVGQVRSMSSLCLLTNTLLALYFQSSMRLNMLLKEESVGATSRALTTTLSFRPPLQLTSNLSIVPPLSLKLQLHLERM